MSMMVRFGGSSCWVRNDEVFSVCFRGNQMGFILKNKNNKYMSFLIDFN